MRNAAPSGRRIASPTFSIAPTMPTFTCVSVNFAFADAITMSASTTKWWPPPMHSPLTAQITGFQTRFWCDDQCTASASGRFANTESASSPPADSASPTSKPVQKWRSPAAVTIATRTSGFSRTSAQIARKIGCIVGVSELPRSGRFSVIVATRSRIS